MLSADDVQSFLIEADAAGDLLQRHVVNRLYNTHVVLDYSRQSLKLLSLAILAIVEDRVAYSVEGAIINSAQYLGETILHALEGEWAPHNNSIDLYLHHEDGHGQWFDVYTPVLKVIQSAIDGDANSGAQILWDTFDAAVTTSLKRCAPP
jgi:hypothetical protein